MAVAEAAMPGPGHKQMEDMLRDLRHEALLMVLPGLLLAGLLLLGNATEASSPAHVILPGVVLYATAIAAFALRSLPHPAPGVVLVLGAVAAEILLASWARIGVAVSLLSVPVGLATLFVSVPGGVLVAAGCSGYLLLAPPGLLPAGGDLRAVSAIGAWCTVGLIWLTLRPLVTALHWSWTSYEQGRGLLEQARDTQVQLKQTLADLAQANLQLTRLNDLAHTLRRAADDARRAKEQFVANVSHELRTPLNMIIGFSEMIMRAPQAYGSNVPPALLADLAVIHRNSQHLSTLVDDVLDLSQIEAGRMALTKERVGLAEIVEAVQVAVAPLFASKGLYLRVEVPAHLPLLYCDRTRIREVLLNLLSNAGRFTEQGGVHLHAWREGQEVTVSVSDTGPGIADADKARLFQPFEQVDGSVRRRYGGTGLGLSISKSFVELHGGRMWLESRLGAGAAFFFSLPIDPEPAPEADMLRWLSPDWEYRQRTRRSLAPVPQVRPRLVVLESGGSLRRLLSRYLDDAEIVPVSSLQAALDEIARVPSQALLCNDASVADALQRLNASAALPEGTPAIICSVPGVDEAAAALGVSDLLIKPVTRERLLGALDRLDLPAGTVLIVDDEPEAQRLFWRMLASSGRDYRVLTAGSGSEALSILAAERPDAILLDLVMPEMDGFRLLELRAQDARLRQVPVVVISARDPVGQPVVSSALAVTQGGGLAMHQLLACVDAMRHILGRPGQTSGPESAAGHPAPPACG